MENLQHFKVYDKSDVELCNQTTVQKEFSVNADTKAIMSPAPKQSQNLSWVQTQIF